MYTTDKCLFIASIVFGYRYAHFILHYKIEVLTY